MALNKKQKKQSLWTPLMGRSSRLICKNSLKRNKFNLEFVFYLSHDYLYTDKKKC